MKTKDGRQVRCPTTEPDGSPQEKVLGCGGVNLTYCKAEGLYDCECGIWFTSEFADPPHTRDDVDADSGEDSDSRCECELPGYFFSGVPGIIGSVVGGKLAIGAAVERCDLCERYPSDQAARDKLIELGIAIGDSCGS